MWMIIGIFFLMLLIGVPVAFGVGISSMLYLALNGKDLVILTQRIFAGGDSFTLMAIPLFIFAGEIMNACGVTKRIVGFANELVGFIPGGLAHVNILASMLFAGVSGSTSADVASIGGMLIGSMDEAGFDRDYATAVTAASATIGSIIPPSILMVLYSSITGISVGKLFMAGVIPGILVGVSQMIYAFIKAKKNPAKYDGDVKVKFDFKRMITFRVVTPNIAMKRTRTHTFRILSTVLRTFFMRGFISFYSIKCGQALCGLPAHFFRERRTVYQRATPMEVRICLPTSVFAQAYAL